MSRFSRIVWLLAFVAASFCSGPANASELDELTAALDVAQELPEYAKLGARLNLAASAMEPGDPGLPGTLTQLARAYYLLGEAERDEDKRMGYLDRAIEAAGRALEIAPDEPCALYWRSMAQLQKADLVGGISALGLVKNALRAFEKVEAALPSYDGAGAYRSHGKVLVEAPAWAFIGDDERGVELLETASEISPGTLINRLYLAQAYEETGRREDAAKELAYIMAAPVSAVKPKDDIEVKREAAEMLEDMAH